MRRLKRLFGIIYIYILENRERQKAQKAVRDKIYIYKEES